MDSLQPPLSEIDQGENEIKISEKLYEELVGLFKNDRDLEIDESSSSSEEDEDTVLAFSKRGRAVIRPVRFRTAVYFWNKIWIWLVNRKVQRIPQS